jgi:hypothetical protein
MPILYINLDNRDAFRMERLLLEMGKTDEDVRAG